MSKIDNQIYDYLTTQLNENSVVIDVGAYIGKIAKRLCESTTSKPYNYYLIEACPNNYDILVKNCTGYNKFNIAINNENGSETVPRGVGPF